jgi:hypothetical protein
MQMPRNTIVRKVPAIAAALVALTVTFIGGTGPTATATQGQPVIAGQYNTATSTTTVANSGAAGDGLNVIATSPGVRGIYASAPGIGVDGNGPTGVRGVSSGSGDGVDGVANNSCCSAVFGKNDGTGNGVAGQADTGTGVLAASTGGIALKVDGKAQFSRSGIVTITYPAKSKVVSGVPLTGKSLVLATQQKFLAGVYVVAAVPNLSGSSNSFTIYLSKAPGTSAVPKSVTVAWQVIERP